MSSTHHETGADKAAAPVQSQQQQGSSDLESLLNTLVSQIRNSDWVEKQQEIAKTEGRKTIWEHVADLEKEEEKGKGETAAAAGAGGGAGAAAAAGAASSSETKEE